MQDIFRSPETASSPFTVGARGGNLLDLVGMMRVIS
jgi:hypothetical protein